MTRCLGDKTPRSGVDEYDSPYRQRDNRLEHQPSQLALPRMSREATDAQDPIPECLDILLQQGSSKLWPRASPPSEATLKTPSPNRGTPDLLLRIPEPE